MSVELIITLIALGVAIIGGVATLVIALIRGEIKKFVEEKMIEAEKLEMSGEQKLQYVLKEVQSKYKIMELFLNVRKFIEHIIALSKQINAK